MAELPTHAFDPVRARSYSPNPAFAKVAVLVDVADPTTTTEINASFGRQRLVGPFYAVADGAGSYGASQAEFDDTHKSVGPNAWVKKAEVLAYPVADRCLVETYVGSTHEATVAAEPGDWIVRQKAGEVMVIRPEEFDKRYVRVGDESS